MLVGVWLWVLDVLVPAVAWTGCTSELLLLDAPDCALSVVERMWQRSFRSVPAPAWVLACVPALMIGNAASCSRKDVW